MAFNKGVTQKKQGGSIIDGFRMVIFTVAIIRHVSSVGGFLLLRLCIVQETKMAHMSFLLPEILNSTAHYM